MKEKWKDFPKLCPGCRREVDKWLESELERVKTIKVTDKDREIAKGLIKKHNL